MYVVVVGTGYVGLVTGVCFASFGHSVVCVDTDLEKIRTLNQGGIPIYEPGLEELVTQNINAGVLSFTTNLRQAMKDADAVFIAVGTPTDDDEGHADLSYVYAATEEIAEEIARIDNPFTVVVTKSTVPVGTGDKVDAILKKHCPPNSYAVVSNPEFLREGTAINDFRRPDRIIVGTDNEKARQLMRELYRPLFLNETPIQFTSRRTSELIKYASNAFLATKITFINEMADLCEMVGGDIQEVAKGIGLDKRIGPKFLNAGPGYGGSCFPKDTLALAKTAQDAGVELSIVESVIKTNNQRKINMGKKIEQALNGELENKKIAILGLAFKPNTDDMRYAPSLAIIPYLQERGAKIQSYDPEAMQEAKKLLSNITYFENAYSCVENADALVIVTEWDQFRALDMSLIRSKLKTPILIDLRNIYKSDDMVKIGFRYISVGRAS